jgi:hypothetical protein
MWPPDPSKPARTLPSGTILGVNYNDLELRILGQTLTRPKSSSMRNEALRMAGVDLSRADELEAAFRLGGSAALEQALSKAEAFSASYGKVAR